MYLGSDTHWTAGAFPDMDTLFTLLSLWLHALSCSSVWSPPYSDLALTFCTCYHLLHESPPHWFMDWHLVPDNYVNVLTPLASETHVGLYPYRASSLPYLDMHLCKGCFPPWLSSSVSWAPESHDIQFISRDSLLTLLELWYPVLCSPLHGAVLSLCGLFLWWAAVFRILLILCGLLYSVSHPNLDI